MSCLGCVLIFFFKQKTAYEMRISDWSSDVCSSDLLLDLRERLEADRDAAAEFPQPRLRVLQPFDPAERIQFVDVKPDTPSERRLERQRLQNGHVHPARDQPPQRRDLVGGVGLPWRPAFSTAEDRRVG